MTNSTCIDLTGKRFGRLVVIRRGVYSAKSGLKWEVVCDCGITKSVDGALLRKGKSRSCGCLRKERMTTHGQYISRTYMAWNSMKQRCRYHPHYKAKGITFCEEWLSFENFMRDMGECPAGLELDRIDNTKGYHPGNCRWATDKQQVRNRSGNKLNEEKAAEIRTSTLSSKELAEKYNVHQVTIRQVRSGEIWK